MVLTACSRGRLSSSQAATTWQSFWPRKALVFPGPIMPQPTTPMVIRSEGAGRPFLPKMLAGMMVGAVIATPAAARKRRRLIPERREEDFISGYDARFGAGIREQNSTQIAPGIP